MRAEKPNECLWMAIVLMLRLNKATGLAVCAAIRLLQNHSIILRRTVIKNIAIAEAMFGIRRTAGIFRCPLVILARKRAVKSIFIINKHAGFIFCGAVESQCLALGGVFTGAED